MNIKNLKISAIIASFLFGSVAVAADDELIVFDWGGYEDEMFFQDYMKKYGEPPTYSFFSDEEEAFQKGQVDIHFLEKLLENLLKMKLLH